MCYSEFGEIIDQIARMDADVISIEASRSGMELLDAFRDFDYPGEIGPGVYDIHSPRVPAVEELEQLLELAERRIGRDRLWVNPDCGLKTRAWPETRAALANLVEVARRRRAAAPARPRMSGILDRLPAAHHDRRRQPPVRKGRRRRTPRARQLRAAVLSRSCLASTAT